MKRVKFSILLLLLIFSTFAAHAQDTVNCEAPDFSGVQEQIAAANAALEAGDLITSLQAREQASQLYRDIQNRCVLEPLGETLGLDAARLEEIAAMPTCQYRFDATVRSGANEGLNLHGLLSLLQDTPTTAVGFIWPDEGGDAVPVWAEFGENRALTLRFELADATMIVGEGTAASTVATCFGVVEGDLTGPGDDDAGDWIGSAFQCLNNPLPCLPGEPVMSPAVDPGGGGTCDANYDPVCVLVCTNGTCRLQCQQQVCIGGGGGG
jgi:hypothetical protein